MTTHPNREELVEFLYQELAPARQAELAGHVEGCPECRAQVESWRLARRELAGWELPARAVAKAEPRSGGVVWRGLGWAAAAAVFLLTGFLAARVLSPKPDMAGLRTAIAQDVRQEFQAELSRYASAQAVSQARYQEAMTKVLGQLEAKRLVDYANLRRDVETVAVSAQNELLSTREDLARLAKLEEPPSP